MSGKTASIAEEDIIKVSNSQKKNRLTMRYNMNALRRLQSIEDEYREKLGLIYGCDGEDIPIEFDLSDLLDQSPEERLESLKRMLASVPQNVTALMDNILDEIDKIND